MLNLSNPASPRVHGFLRHCIYLGQRRPSEPWGPCSNDGIKFTPLLRICRKHLA